MEPVWTALFWSVASAVVLVLYWYRYTRRPQDVFRLASRSEQSVQELRSWLAEGMRNERAFAVLADLYAPLVDDLRCTPGLEDVDWPVDAEGRKVLALTLAARQSQRIDEVIRQADGVRSPHWAGRVSEFAGERQMFMAALRRNVSFTNPFGDEQGDNLVLDHIRGGQTIALRASTASYGQIVRTSDSLINEFALFGHILGRSAVRRRPSDLPLAGDRLLALLPWRRAVHAWDPGTDLFVAPRGRAAGLGVAVVLHERRGHDVTALLARRSASVGTYPDALHVIPAGMLNVRSSEPLTGDVDFGQLVRLTALAEFLEECFNLAELSGHSVSNFAGVVSRELSDRGLVDVEPRFTGVAVDLLNLRTEICATLDLSDHPEVLKGFVTSWEFSHNEAIRKVDLRSGSGIASRSEFVQSGLGALHLASRAITSPSSASSSVS